MAIKWIRSVSSPFAASLHCRGTAAFVRVAGVGEFSRMPGGCAVRSQRMEPPTPMVPSIATTLPRPERVVVFVEVS